MDQADLILHSMLSLESLQSLVYYAQCSPPGGSIVEVGVYRGGSAYFLAQLERPLYLYDTFEGIPFQGPLDGNHVGKFSDTSAEAVQALIPHATVIKGLFPQTCVDMGPISFVHVDCDQYESVKACINVLGPRMVHGGMMLFDDFGVADCEGATRAVQESGRPYSVIAHTGKALMIF